jgi:putative AdoMet-dependent methyltransferase
MDEPYPASDFDAWAQEYDLSVGKDAFPFWGYPTCIQRIATISKAQPGQQVLDLGSGTGNLALHFARLGCELWCTDFSPLMLEEARRKLPGAHFLLHDLRRPLPADWAGPFDAIVSAYVFHHFPLEEKVAILLACSRRLAPAGRMILGDIAFADAPAMEAVRLLTGPDWEQEEYWLADEALPALENAGFKVEYEQVSRCAGLFSLWNNQ